MATAFLGCRISEIAQLDIASDLCRDDASGVYFVDFNRAPDSDGVLRKGLKMKASRRLVPLHSALVRHGFVEYLNAQIAAGFTRPFERGWKPYREQERGEVRWELYIVRWGEREIKKLRESGALGDTGASKLSYFHSMRHALATTLAMLDVPEERRAALQGQQHGGENARRYAKLREDVLGHSKMMESSLSGYAALLDAAIASP
ncbi:MAG TPA: hypothetical protein VFB54_09750 [Burkholderiales bacterium]|nr:hypothetical protein [Burkholderiales bacterium]